MVYIANTVLYMEQYMINLNELAIFVEVVDSGNFTSAARRLGLPKSNVSRKIALLESRLETRLLHRNTRSMSSPRLVVDITNTVVSWSTTHERLRKLFPDCS